MTKIEKMLYGMVKRLERRVDMCEMVIQAMHNATIATLHKKGGK